MRKKKALLSPDSGIVALLLTSPNSAHQYKILSQTLRPAAISMFAVALFGLAILISAPFFQEFYNTSYDNILMLYIPLTVQAALLCILSIYELWTCKRHLIITHVITSWAMIFIMLWGTAILVLSVWEHRVPNYITWLLGNLLVVTLGVYTPIILFSTAVADTILIFAFLWNIPDASIKTTILNCILFILAYVLIGSTRYISALKNILYTEQVEQQKKDLQQETRRAEEANLAKTTFLANMSHEIRTPINVVLGMNELILRDCTDKKIKNYAINTQSAGRLLLDTISDILDFVKIESGKLEICTKEYMISSMLNDLLMITRVRAAEKNLEFIARIPADIPCQLYGDELRLKQAISNVLSNAVKYTPAGSVTFDVLWRTLVPADVIELVFTVTDTGIGMTADGITRIFEKFERLDLERNQSVEGTGLGMSITKSILDLMGGTISVTSTYGEGSTFIITVTQKVCSRTPIGNISISVSSEQSETLTTNVATTTFPTAHILVVDDNDLNLQVIRGLLKPYEAQVCCADSGKNALKLLEAANKRNIHFDLIFMDHMMPEMNGLETVQTIRRLAVQEHSEYFRIVPIVALTANVMRGAKEEYLSGGMQDFLAKPIIPKALDQCLMRWLSHR